MRTIAFATALAGTLLVAALPAMAAGEDTPATCQDGKDNDMDGLADCADSECTVMTFCEAPPAPAGYEDTPALCKDGADADGDGKVDCNDPDCAVMTFCESTAGQAQPVQPATQPVQPAQPAQPAAATAQPAAAAAPVDIPPDVKRYSTEEVKLLLGEDIARIYGKSTGPRIGSSVMTMVATCLLLGSSIWSAVGWDAFSLALIPPALIFTNVGTFLSQASTSWKAKALIEAGLDVDFRRGGMTAGNIVFLVFSLGGTGVAYAGMALLASRSDAGLPMAIAGCSALLVGGIVGSIVFGVAQKRTEASIRANLDGLRSGTIVPALSFVPVDGGGMVSVSGTF